MKRIWIYLGLVLLALLLIQLVRPEKNLGEIETAEDFIQVSLVPDTLARVFLNSCYDCHSNRTSYPWYGNLAPASWFLNKHVVEGKAHLNFSSWGLMDKAQKISMLDEICDECTEGNMPLGSYLLLHRSSSLDALEIKAICDWADEEAMKIMNSKE
jgi:hypothetical protein